MQKNKIIYWATTGLIGAMMLFSAFGYMTNPEIKAMFLQTGFPDFFRIELAIAKGLGGLALVIPGVPRILKMFSYAGFVIVFASAAFTHFAIGDAKGAIAPLVFMGVLAVSYVYYHKLNGTQA